MKLEESRNVDFTNTCSSGKAVVAIIKSIKSVNILLTFLRATLYSYCVCCGNTSIYFRKLVKFEQMSTCP